eukprot:356942-Chlamydomonas_euryale.AAC.1
MPPPAVHSPFPPRDAASPLPMAAAAASPRRRRRCHRRRCRAPRETPTASPAAAAAARRSPNELSPPALACHGDGPRGRSVQRQELATRRPQQREAVQRGARGPYLTRLHGRAGHVDVRGACNFQTGIAPRATAAAGAGPAPRQSPPAGGDVGPARRPSRPLGCAGRPTSARHRQEHLRRAGSRPPPGSDWPRNWAAERCSQGGKGRGARGAAR